MNSALSEQSDDSSYYLGEDGLIITATTANENHTYSFVIINEKLSFPNFSNVKSDSIIGTFINRTSLVLTSIVLLLSLQSLLFHL